MPLAEFFDAALVRRASTIGLDHTLADGTLRSLTFGELAVRRNRMARALVSRGLVRGDRLALFLPNRLEFVDLWLACTAIGVIVVPMNVLYRERELRHILGDAEPTAVVTTVVLSAELPTGTVWWEIDALAAECAGHDSASLAVTVFDDDPAALVYTSGTTGAAKGAILTHRNFMVNGQALVDAWHITSADRYLALLPLFHVHGLGNGVHAWLASGCRMRLVERFEHATAPDVFDAFRPTLVFGVPTMYVRMLDWPAQRAHAIGAHMRLFVSGSAPLPVHVLEQFTRVYGHTILERYGMTETLMIAGNPYDGERRAGTVGAPFAHVALRVVDAVGQPVSAGVSGEVEVRGPNVCAGYWRRPEMASMFANANANATANGPSSVHPWFATGDMGVQSADGYLTLEGRKSDLIISGGFNIYPREIEDVLTEQPGVLEAAVIGVADALKGEVVVAYVVTDGDVDTTVLETAMRTQLASFKVPRAFVKVETLPRTALGKVQRHLLPAWHTP